MYSLKQEIFKLAKKNNAKIAIGLLEASNSIKDSLKRASSFADITIIGKKIKGFKYIPANKDNIEEKEVKLILSKKIDGLIRGQADTYKFEDLLSKKAGYSREQVLVSGLFEDQFKRMFFTTSGSHSDGWTIKSKILMVDELIKKMNGLKIKPKIAFLTWVRPGSVGRNFFLDQSWEQAEYLVKYYNKKGYKVKNYNIEIETALNDGANLICFATGASGNMFSRTLAFLVKNPFYIYFHTGIRENIIENNRTVQDYFNMVLGASAFAKPSKQKYEKK